MKDPLASIRADAARLLARRSHSRRQLESKLRRRHARDDIRTVLEDLESGGYLDDHAFAMDRAAHLRETRLWGDQRISLDLRRAGIGARMIGSVLDELNRAKPQAETLQLLIQSWIEKSGEPQTPGSARKLFQHCLARGFPRSKVREALEPILQSLDWNA